MEEHRLGLRCLVADRSAIFALGLETALDSDQVAIAGWVEDPSRLGEFLRKEPVDVVLSCFEPVSEAINVCHSVDGCPVLILSSMLDDTTVVEAVRAGARGVLPKYASRQELRAAVSRVARGEMVLPAGWEQRVSRIVDMSDQTRRERQRLSQRERDVMHQLVRGYSNKQVARELGIAEQTVKNHIRHIMAKLGVSTRVQLTRWALETSGPSQREPSGVQTIRGAPEIY